MPTTIVNQADVLAHVPVDNFEIVNGPGATKLLEIQEELHRHERDMEPYYVEVTFTLKTLASDTSFKRKLRIAYIHSIFEGSLGFSAIFSNGIVSGDYDVKTRTGWFSFD